MVVAFLFTIENGIVHEDIWKAYFKYVPSHCYRVFVHARQPSRLVEGSTHIVCITCFLGRLKTGLGEADLIDPFLRRHQAQPEGLWGISNGVFLSPWEI
jgi:hypothetical protein